MMDKLDNFWIDFKSLNLIEIDLCESKRDISTTEFINWMTSIHSNIINKTNNIVKIVTYPNFPTLFNIQRLIFKRVISILLTNSIENNYREHISVFLNYEVYSYDKKTDDI